MQTSQKESVICVVHCKTEGILLTLGRHDMALLSARQIGCALRMNTYLICGATCCNSLKFWVLAGRVLSSQQCLQTFILSSFDS